MPPVPASHMTGGPMTGGPVTGGPGRVAADPATAGAVPLRPQGQAGSFGAESSAATVIAKPNLESGPRVLLGQPDAPRTSGPVRTAGPALTHGDTSLVAQANQAAHNQRRFSPGTLEPGTLGPRRTGPSPGTRPSGATTAVASTYAVADAERAEFEAIPPTPPPSSALAHAPTAPHPQQSTGSLTLPATGGPRLTDTVPGPGPVAAPAMAVSTMGPVPIISSAPVGSSVQVTAEIPDRERGGSRRTWMYAALFAGMALLTTGLVLAGIFSGHIRLEKLGLPSGNPFSNPSLDEASENGAQGSPSDSAAGKVLTSDVLARDAGDSQEQPTAPGMSDKKTALTVAAGPKKSSVRVARPRTAGHAKAVSPLEPQSTGTATEDAGVAPVHAPKIAHRVTPPPSDHPEEDLSDLRGVEFPASGASVGPRVRTQNRPQDLDFDDEANLAMAGGLDPGDQESGDQESRIR